MDSMHELHMCSRCVPPLAESQSGWGPAEHQGLALPWHALPWQGLMPTQSAAPEVPEACPCQCKQLPGPSRH